MQKCPDVLAQELDRARARCTEAGWEVDVQHTQPPGGISSSIFRVVRLRVTAPGKVILTAAGEQEPAGAGINL